MIVNVSRDFIHLRRSIVEFTLHKRIIDQAPSPCKASSQRPCSTLALTAKISTTNPHPALSIGARVFNPISQEPDPKQTESFGFGFGGSSSSGHLLSDTVRYCLPYEGIACIPPPQHFMTKTEDIDTVSVLCGLWSSWSKQRR